MDRNYMSILRFQVLGNARLTAPKLFLQKLCSSDHNNNVQQAILGTVRLSSSSKILFSPHILNITQYHDIWTLCTVHVIQQFCMCAYNCLQHNVQYHCVRSFRLVELTPSCDPTHMGCGWHNWSHDADTLWRNRSRGRHFVTQLITWSRNFVMQLIIWGRNFVKQLITRHILWRNWSHEAGTVTQSITWGRNFVTQLVTWGRNFVKQLITWGRNFVKQLITWPIFCDATDHMRQELCGATVHMRHILWRNWSYEAWTLWRNWSYEAWTLWRNWSHEARTLWRNWSHEARTLWRNWSHEAYFVTQLITWGRYLVTQLIHFLKRRPQLVLPHSKWSLSPPKPCHHFVLYSIRTASHSTSLPLVPH